MIILLFVAKPFSFALLPHRGGVFSPRRSPRLPPFAVVRYARHRGILRERRDRKATLLSDFFTRFLQPLDPIHLVLIHWQLPNCDEACNFSGMFPTDDPPLFTDLLLPTTRSASIS